MADSPALPICKERRRSQTISKDRAAKPVDYVSAIGGTMGLFTGFSIISGVEIIYFAVKIVRSMLKKSDENKVS